MAAVTNDPAPVGRPRDPELEQAILEAAVEVVVESGFAAARVEEIARRAGTGKAAIYRRWDSKTALVIAAAERMQAEVTVPDTGSLRDDLLICVRHYISPNARAALVLANVLAEATRNTEVREAASASIGRPPARALRTVIERAVARGDVDAAVPVELIASIVPAVAFQRVTVQHRGLDEPTAVALVDDVLLPALAVRPRARG